MGHGAIVKVHLRWLSKWCRHQFGQFRRKRCSIWHQATIRRRPSLDSFGILDAFSRFTGRRIWQLENNSPDDPDGPDLFTISPNFQFLPYIFSASASAGAE